MLPRPILRLMAQGPIRVGAGWGIAGGSKRSRGLEFAPLAQTEFAHLDHQAGVVENDSQPMLVKESRMASLIVVSGPNEGDYYPLRTRTIVIGRDEGCPVQIVEGMASRRHLQIRNESGKYIANDMKSTNGTFINGRELKTEVDLVDEDEITIGSSKLVFSAKDFPDRESAFNHWKQRGQRGKPTLMP